MGSYLDMQVAAAFTGGLTFTYAYHQIDNTPSLGLKKNTRNARGCSDLISVENIVTLGPPPPSLRRRAVRTQAAAFAGPPSFCCPYTRTMPSPRRYSRVPPISSFSLWRTRPPPSNRPCVLSHGSVMQIVIQVLVSISVHGLMR